MLHCTIVNNNNNNNNGLESCALSQRFRNQRKPADSAGEKSGLQHFTLVMCCIFNAKLPIRVGCVNGRRVTECQKGVKSLVLKG